MAKMMFENLNAIVANTLTDSIKMIDISELHNSDDNFFDINRVEEFAETILGQGGVKDNLIVRPLETGGYEIISGHRRKAAVQYLLDNGENISRYLPCLVQSYDDNDDKVLDIVLMNISSRQISDSEMWKSYEVVNEILMRKKEAGEKFGRVRNKLAECLGVSPAQVGKMRNVEKNAIEPVKEAISNGEISIYTADKIANLEQEEQEKIVKSDLGSIKPKDISKKRATNSTISKDNKIERNEEVEKIEKICATNSTFLEDDTSEFDEEETEDIDFDSDFSENSIPEADEETDIDDDFSENAVAVSEPDEPETEMTLTEFVYQHYFDIESILTAYVSMIDMTDDSDDFEIELIEKFQKLLYQTKGSREK